MSNKLLILSCDKWNFQDEKTGEVKSGVSIWSLSNYRQDTDREKGLKPQKISSDPSFFDLLKGLTLPILVDPSYTILPGAQGASSVRLVGFKNPQPVKIFN
ncbi:MAG: hypothetical protein M0P09_06200 [Acholeplasmataceae bacterium]|nr:hypothetical protein [Acholeplasmataceae bacterium]